MSCAQNEFELRFKRWRDGRVKHDVVTVANQHTTHLSNDRLGIVGVIANVSVAEAGFHKGRSAGSHDARFGGRR